MEELEQALVAICEKSALPLEAIRYVLKHLYGMADLNYQLATEKKKAESEKERNDNGGSDRAD